MSEKLVSLKRQGYTIEQVQSALKYFSVDKLDDLSNEWMRMSGPASTAFESKADWEARKDIMIPLIVNEKLNKYESGEAFS